MTNKGKFIVFEGIDASGKGTQSNLLCERFDELKINYIYTREPLMEISSISRLINGVADLTAKYNGLTPQNSKKFKLAPQTMSLLFAADRAEHVQKIIIPTLEKGINVVCDRYYASSLAYQGALDNVDEDWILQINRFCIQPDIVFLLDIDPNKSLNRIKGEKDRRHAEFEELSKQILVRDKYLKLSKQFKNWKIINADDNKESIFQKIIAELKPLINC